MGEASITLSGVWLHDVDDPENTVSRFQYDGKGRDADWQPECVLTQYAGRVNPVADFGEAESEKAVAQLQLFTDIEYNELKTLIKSKKTLCYRDSSGRKMFGVVRAFPVTDEKPSWYSTTVEITKTDHTEAV